MLHIQKSPLLFRSKAVFASSSINSIDSNAATVLSASVFEWPRFLGEESSGLNFFSSTFYLAYFLSLNRYMKDKFVWLYVLEVTPVTYLFILSTFAVKNQMHLLQVLQLKVTWYRISVWCALTDIQSSIWGISDTGAGTILVSGVFLNVLTLSSCFYPSSPPFSSSLSETRRWGRSSSYTSRGEIMLASSG